MATQQAVKSSYTHNDREYNTYWNGKAYASGVYVTVTSPNGKEFKVQFDSRKSGNQKFIFPSLSVCSLDEAKKALESVGFDWKQYFDFGA